MRHLCVLLKVPLVCQLKSIFDANAFQIMLSNLCATTRPLLIASTRSEAPTNLNRRAKGDRASWRACAPLSAPTARITEYRPHNSVYLAKFTNQFANRGSQRFPQTFARACINAPHKTRLICRSCMIINGCEYMGGRTCT